MSDGLRLAAALAALFCAAGCMRLAFALVACHAVAAARSRAPRCWCSSGSVAGAALATAGALAAARPVLDCGRRWSGPSRRASPRPSPCPSPARIEAPAPQRPRARPLARSREPRGGGGRRATRRGHARRGALADRRRGARAALGPRRARAPDRGRRSRGRRGRARRARRGGRAGRRRAVRARRGHVAGGDRLRGLQRGRARVARRRSRPSAAARSPASRRAPAPPRRAALDAVVGGVARKLAALHDSGAVAAALAAELRSRLPIESVGVRLGEEPERWYPAPAAPERRSPARRGGARLRRLRARHRRLCAHAPAHARRGAARRPRGATPARSRSAWPACAAPGASSRPRRRRSCAPPRSLGRRAAPEIACCSGWRRSCRARCTPTPPRSGCDEPEQERLRVTHVHGHPITLLGATVSSRIGAAGAAISGGRPVVELHEADEPRRAPRARRGAARAGRAAAPRAAACAARWWSPPTSPTPASRPPTSSSGRRSRGSPRWPSRPRRPTTSAARRRASTAPPPSSPPSSRWRATATVCASRWRASRAQTLGADAARVRLGVPSSRTASRARARRRSGSSCWRLRERRVVASGGLGSDSRVSAEERRRVPGAALLAVPIAHDGARAARRRRDAAVAAHARVRRCRRRARRAAAASAAAAAVERVQLEEAERRASTTARELQRVGALLAADLDPRAVLRQIVAQAVSLLGADACALRLLEEDELVAARRPRARRSRASAASGSRVSDVLAAEVLATSRPVALDDLAADGRLAPDDPVLRRRASRAGPARRSRAPTAAMQGMLAIFGRQPAAPARRRGRGARRVRELGLGRAPQRAPVRGRGEREGSRRGDPRARRRRHRRHRRRRTASCSGTRPPSRSRRSPSARALGRVLGRAAVERARRRRRLGARHARAAPAADRAPRCGSRARARSSGSRSPRPRHERRATAGRAACSRCATSPRCARLEQLKSDFVATVSHELRTPLTSIYGFAETLLREDASFGEEDRATFVRYIASETERLNRLVEALLSAARLETGAVGLAARARSTSPRSRATSPPGPAAAPSSTSSRSCCRRAARSPRPTPIACARC